MNYVYDDQGNQVEHMKYRSDGSLISGYKRNYDVRGNLVGEKEIESDGSTLSRSVYMYDADGNLIKWVHYMSRTDELTRYETYDYNAQGNHILTTQQDGFVNKECTHEYDSCLLYTSPSPRDRG